MNTSVQNRPSQHQSMITEFTIGQRWLILLLFTIFWFMMMGYRDLAEPDEARYAEIPREMLVNGDWVTPRLNGLKYFEKPPLQYWATAISYKIFGINKFSVRLWPTVLGFLCVFWVAYVGRRIFDVRAGIIAAAITGSSLMWVVMGDVVTLDMGVTTFLTLGMGSLFIAQSRRDNPIHVRNWMLFGWFALALTMLSKGLIALVIPGGALFFYMLWQRDWSLLKQLHLGKGLLLFVALTAPWFFLVEQRNPGFNEFFFLHEHLQRFTTKIHGREEPLWFFSTMFLIGTLPWTLTALATLIKPGFNWSSTKNQFDVRKLLWTYVVFILVFFSFSGSQLPPYILPLIPAIALLIGRKFSEQFSLMPNIILTVIVGVCVLILSQSLHKLTAHNLPLEYLLNMQPWLVAAGISMIATAGASWWVSKKQPLAVVTLALGFLFSFQLIDAGYDNLSDLKTVRREAAAIKQLEHDGPIPVYSIANYPQGLPFYLGHTIELVIMGGELEYGLKEEPQRSIPLATFYERWNKPLQAVAVMYPSMYTELVKQNIPMQIIYEDIELVVVKRL